MNDMVATVISILFFFILMVIYMISYISMFEIPKLLINIKCHIIRLSTATLLVLQSILCFLVSLYFENFGIAIAGLILAIVWSTHLHSAWQDYKNFIKEQNKSS